MSKTKWSGFLLLFLATNFVTDLAWAAAPDQKITGVVTVAPNLEAKLNPSDVLYVYARAMGSTGGPPAAVVRIANPKFPQKFELSSGNAMMPGTPFKGPFMIQAKLSKSGTVTTTKGDLMGKYAPKKGVLVGVSEVKVELSEEAR